MKVSILVLTYNHAKYIETTLNSLINQKVNFDYEIVIAEDCSPDNTLEICQSYAKQHPFIRILKREKNLGEIINFASAIKECIDSEYVAFCEGDDSWIDENKLQTQVEFLDKNLDYVMHVTDCYYINEKGEKGGAFSGGRFNKNLLDSTISLKHVLLSRLRPIHISSSLMRGCNVELPPSYMETPILDTPFLFYMCNKGKVFYSSEKTATYRKHSESITTKSGFSKKYLSDLKLMFLRLDKELEYKYSKYIPTAIANRYILALKIEWSKQKKLSIALLLLQYIFKSKSYNLKDWLYIIRN